MFGLVSALLVAGAMWLPLRFVSRRIVVCSLHTACRERRTTASESICTRATGTKRLRKLLQDGNLVEIAVAANGDAVPVHLFSEPVFGPFSLADSLAIGTTVVAVVATIYYFSYRGAKG